VLQDNICLLLTSMLYRSRSWSSFFECFTHGVRYPLGTYWYLFDGKIVSPGVEEGKNSCLHSK